MIIEYDVHCFERTLVIKCPNNYAEHEDKILKILDTAYYEWHSPEDIEDPIEQKMVNDSCCEEHMMYRLSETYNMWEWWDTEYYGDDEEEMYETIPVKNERDKTSAYKCKACGEIIEFYEAEFDSVGEEALWEHIQMNHVDIYGEVQDWETPYMIEDYYEEEV